MYLYNIIVQFFEKAFKTTVFHFLIGKIFLKTKLYIPINELENFSNKIINFTNIYVEKTTKDSTFFGQKTRSAQPPLPQVGNIIVQLILLKDITIYILYEAFQPFTFFLLCLVKKHLKVYQWWKKQSFEVLFTWSNFQLGYPFLSRLFKNYSFG